MNIWNTLGIGPEASSSEIKKAYAKMLKIHNPESDPEGFQQLREAYEMAIKHKNRSVEQLRNPDKDKNNNEKADNLYVEETGYNVETINDQNSKENSIKEFMSQIEKLYKDAAVRNDVNEWRSLLDSELLWNLEEREIVSYALRDFLWNNFHLSTEIWSLLDSYFNWSLRDDSFSALVKQELLLALDYDDEDIVFRLLENGVDTETINRSGMTPLIAASRFGSIRIVMLLVHYGANLEAKDNEKKTALFWAAENRQMDILQILIESGADIDTCNKDGLTPLMSAAIEGDSEMLEFLLESGAAVNQAMENGSTALSFAIENEQKELIRILIENGANVSSLNLVCSSSIGLMDRVKYLIEVEGTDIEEKNADGKTALYVAVENNHKDVASYLLQKGANSSAENKSFWTPLQEAALEGNIEMMQLLVDNGVDLDYCNSCSGSTVLESAACDQVFAAMDFLLEHGADINARKDDAYTPLLYCCLMDRFNSVKYLIEHGADIHLKDRNGKDALIMAVTGNAMKILKYLLEHGGDIQTRDNKGRNLLLRAAECADRKMIDYLLNMGFSLEDTDYEGNNVLLLAAPEEDVRIVEYFIKKSCDINYKNKSGQTALMLAAESESLKMVKFLVSLGADIHERDNQGKTALDYANETEDRALIRYLKKLV